MANKGYGGGYGSGFSRGGYRDRYDTIFEHSTAETVSSTKPFPPSVAAGVAAMLTLNGKRVPYSHQAQAAEASLDERKNVALVTHTASGKTVSFLAPVLTTLVNEPEAVAMMIYPMNALATDQLKNLVDLGFQEVHGRPGLYSAVIDGVEITAGVMNRDTSDAVRRGIRDGARLIITNHAALHASILQQAQREYADGTSWRRIFRNLRALVLDEAHSYNGVQGTNAALAFRRLFAMVESMGAAVPQVILATATIGNPLDHALALTGIRENWVIIDKSGAKQHRRDYQVVLPAEHPRGGRWAASVIAQEIALEEVMARRKVMVFCPSRSGTERMADKINEKLGRKAALAFNSSIPAAQKREFLAAILGGFVDVVCATSALELGVDIGSMDTVIILGHPGDHASFNQRCGRVGRIRAGRVYLVLDENQHPINNYLESNPEAIFWEPECRTVYPENKIIGVKHAACSYLETQDLAIVRRWFPAVSEKAIFDAISAGMTYNAISMVGLGNFGQFKCLDTTGRPIQELGGQDALLHWHKGAVVRSPIGEFFRVLELDSNGMVARTEDARTGGRMAYTSPKIQSTELPVPGSEEPVSTEKLPILGIERATVADYDVTCQTYGYTEYRGSGGSDMDGSGDYHALDPEEQNPAIGLFTRGFAFSIYAGHPLHDFVMKNEGASRAMADGLGNAVSLMVQARSNDVPVSIRCDGSGLHFLVYDMAEGGMGWAHALVGRLDKWMVAGGKTLKNCRCRLAGCPRCSLSPVADDRRRELADLMIATGKSKTQV
jgi:DEAD/DEAH box helicase domain-containing protein